MINFPRNVMSNRLAMTTLSNFLDVLIEDKVSFETIVDREIIDKLKDSMISRGNAYETKGDVFCFDKELDNLLDDATKNIIKDLLKSIKNLKLEKYLNEFILKKIF